MTTVYATGNGAIRARIEASGAALALFRTGERNRLIRDALVSAGQSWILGFLPSRFSEYAHRKPFGYPKRPVGLATVKLRTAPRGPLADLWQAIKLREFRGWDPWSPFAAPRELLDRFLQTNRSRYLRPRAGFDWKAASKGLRAWAKERTREIAGNLAADGVMLPLVFTGDLRDQFSKQARARATATQKSARLTITIPRGNRQNKWAVKILGMLPGWEFDAIVRWFDRALGQGLQTGIAARVKASVDGRSTGAGVPRRSPASAPRRAA